MEVSYVKNGGIIERAIKMVKGIESKEQKVDKMSTSEEPVTNEDADITESEEDTPTEPEEDLKEEE